MFALVAVVLALGAPPPHVRIAHLDGKVVRDGPLYSLRLDGVACVDPARAATQLYPSEIVITHYDVSRSRRSWWPARRVVDRAPWLVPVGETWHGRRCGPVEVEDPIPPVHYGVESLGNPLHCYGAELTLVFGKVRATKRTIVTCGRRFG